MPDFLPERTYALSVLLGDFLGLEYRIEPKEMAEPCWVFQLPNGNVLRFNDVFFAAQKDSPLWWIHIHPPIQVKKTEFPGFEHKNQVVLFGSPEYEAKENGQAKSLKILHDLPAALFFMLSRWEEAHPELKDEHGRFPESELLAVREHFIQRPVVNEYVEFFWECLLRLGYSGNRKKYSYSLVPSHDVDYFSRFSSARQVIKVLGSDLFKRFSPKDFTDDLLLWAGNVLGLKADPFHSFDLLMDVSEKFGLKSEFYFMAGQRGMRDIDYEVQDQKVENTLSSIRQRGHRIGLHGSYDSFGQPEFLRTEKKRMSQFLTKPASNRQHYLRVRPDRFAAIEAAGFRHDSSVGLSSTTGFRSGCCWPYPVFDLYQRKKLKLIENPVIAMDVAMWKLFSSPQEMLNHLINLSMVVKRYNGRFVFLWHNSNFGLPEWKKFAAVYPLMIQSML